MGETEIERGVMIVTLSTTLMDISQRVAALEKKLADTIPTPPEVQE